jgi:hypothetical protein
MTDNLEDEHCPRGMKAAPRQNALASKMGWYQLDLSPTQAERAAGKTVTSKPFISDQWVGTPKTYAEAKWDMMWSPWNLLPGGGYRWNLADYEGAKAFEKTVRDHNPDYCINLAGDIDYDGTKCINWYNPDTLEICKDTGKFEAGDCVRHGSACCPHDCGTCPGNPDAKTKIECETMEPEEKQVCEVRASSVYKDAQEACAGVESAYHSCVEANCKQREIGVLECERQCKLQEATVTCQKEAYDEYVRRRHICQQSVSKPIWEADRTKCHKCTDIRYCDQTGKRAVMWQHRDKWQNRVLQHTDANGTKAVYPKCKDLRYAQVRGRSLSCSDYYEINPDGGPSLYCMDNDDDTKPCKAMDNVDDPEDIVNSACHDRCTTPAFLDTLGGSFSQHGVSDLANDAQEVTRCETEYVPSLENVPTHCSTEQKSNLCDWIVGGNLNERCHKPDHGGPNDMCHLNLVCQTDPAHRRGDPTPRCRART